MALLATYHSTVFDGTAAVRDILSADRADLGTCVDQKVTLGDAIRHELAVLHCAVDDEQAVLRDPAVLRVHDARTTWFLWRLAAAVLHGLAAATTADFRASTSWTS